MVSRCALARVPVHPRRTHSRGRPAGSPDGRSTTSRSCSVPVRSRRPATKPGSPASGNPRPSTIHRAGPASDGRAAGSPSAPQKSLTVFTTRSSGSLYRSGAPPGRCHRTSPVPRSRRGNLRHPYYSPHYAPARHATRQHRLDDDRGWPVDANDGRPRAGGRVGGPLLTPAKGCGQDAQYVAWESPARRSGQSGCREHHTTAPQRPNTCVPARRLDSDTPQHRPQETASYAVLNGCPHFPPKDRRAVSGEKSPGVNLNR